MKKLLVLVAAAANVTDASDWPRPQELSFVSRSGHRSLAEVSTALTGEDRIGVLLIMATGYGCHGYPVAGEVKIDTKSKVDDVFIKRSLCRQH